VKTLEKTMLIDLIKTHALTEAQAGKWEDVAAKMYELPFDLQSEEAAIIELLSNPDGLLDAMTDVTINWPNATEHQLTKQEHRYG
jgi:hypothetical protein